MWYIACEYCLADTSRKHNYYNQLALVLLYIGCMYGYDLNYISKYRQIEKLTDQRIQQSITSGQKVEVVKRAGEKKVSQMKQELKEEQTKSTQKEEEIEKLKRYIY